MGNTAFVGLVALAALAAGCAARDYTWDGPCPAPVYSELFFESVCDLGAGEDPRFVSVDVCAAKAGIMILDERHRAGASLSSTHPARNRCPAFMLATYDDVRENLHINPR